MSEKNKKIDSLKEELNKLLNKLRIKKIGTGALGFGSLAIILLNYVTGLFFTTLGGFGLFATLGAIGLTDFIAACRKSNKLKKYGEHLDNLKNKSVKNTAELNKKRTAKVKEHSEKLVKANKKTALLDKIQTWAAIGTLPFVIFTSMSPLALLAPVVAIASGIIRRFPGKKEADLEARIKCIKVDKEIASLTPAAPATSTQNTNQNVLSLNRGNTNSYSKTYNSEPTSTYSFDKQKVLVKR